MRVIQAIRFGGAEVLVPSEVPDPVADTGEVVVDISAADTNFVDTLLRRGIGPWSVAPPYVPGFGGAGYVTAVGDGVDGSWVGRRVIANAAVHPSRAQIETVAQSAARTAPTGGYAERVVAPAATLIPVPDGLGLPEAAALMNDGTTAMLLAECVKVQPGERVLVTPAGGGVGGLLVQLAHAAGGRVIAAARGQRKLDLARELGAEAAVDYSEDGWPRRVREATGGTGPDVTLDGVGGQIGRTTFELTARGGRFLAYGGPSGGFTVIDEEEADQHGVTAHLLLDLEWTAADERRLPERALAEAAGRIRPIIGQTFPLEKAAEAHAAIEARAVIGKTVLLPAT